jgi:hypothetical protein
MKRRLNAICRVLFIPKTLHIDLNPYENFYERIALTECAMLGDRNSESSRNLDTEWQRVLFFRFPVAVAC